jgi:hypothetical protein
MAAGQMALPMERRNGASSRRPSPSTPAPAPEPAAPAPTITAAPASPAVEVEAARWVRRVTTLAVVLVAGVAAVASYESPYVKRWVG